MKRRPVSDCHQPWESLVIDPEGGVQPCCFASGQVGNLHETTLDEIWNGARMIRVRGAIRDGFVDPICRDAGCSFVRDTESIHGLDSYDCRCGLGIFIPTNDVGRTGFCVAGWATAEPWGIWSEGSNAQLVLELTERPAGEIEVHFLCRGAAGVDSPVMRVDVGLNGRQLGSWEFAYPEETDASVWRGVAVPADLATSTRFEFMFRIDHPYSPQRSWVDDRRQLGIGLSGLQVSGAAVDKA